MADADLLPPPQSLLQGAALFLDFDGTLVELAEAPDAIRVPGHLSPLLKRLSDQLGGRLAIVSGRAIADLERHVECSGFAVSGSHGLELRLGGKAVGTRRPPPSLERARSEIARFADTSEGLLVEEKPFSIALHYRQAPERAEAVEQFMASLAEDTGLSLQRGKMVLELRPDGAHKGDALRSLMAEPPFAGARPVFVGDDLTDEHAFAAATAMGGSGVLVGAARDTAAQWRLPSVNAVAEWLESD